MLECRDFLDLETLCRELDTSESSVRRDLDLLEQGNLLKRVYGGAVPAQPTIGNGFDFTVESRRSSDEKRRIARLAAGLVENGQTVILDGGSTVAAVAQEIGSKSLHVVTNSLPIAEMLEANRSIELTLTGGYLDPRIRVMLGPLCEQMLGMIRADVVIMGTGGVSDAGFSNNNTLVVGSEQKMIEIADRLIVVADHTKFHRSAMIPVTRLDAADVVISDAALAPEYVAMLRAKEVEVLLA